MKSISFDDGKERAVVLGEYIIAHRATVRAAGKAFGISKSTVHKDITERLPEADPAVYEEAKKILEINKQERHIRGGMATKHKYEAYRKNGAALTEKKRKKSNQQY